MWRWLNPTLVWQPGQTFSLPFALDIDEPLPPGAYRLVAGAWHTNSGKLPAESFVGHASDGIATIGWVKVAQDQPPTIPPGAKPLAYEFGGIFSLRHVAVERAESGFTEVALYWAAARGFPTINATDVPARLGRAAASWSRKAINCLGTGAIRPLSGRRAKP